jgi:hypothetical protein
MRGDYGSYFAWFSDGLHERGPALVIETLRRNVPDMFAHVVHRLEPASNPLPELLFSLCTGLLAIVGSIRLARRVPVTFSFLLGYLAIAAVWPFVPLRFLLGIWVLLLLLLAAGAEALADDDIPGAIWRLHRVRLTRRALAIGAAAVLSGGVLAYNVRGYSRHWWSSTQAMGMRWIAPKLPWIVANTDSTAIIATDHDEGAVYLYTGRRSVPVTTFTATEYLEPRSAEADAAVLRDLTTRYRAQYLLLSSLRLRPTAAAMSTAGIALGDGMHDVVPWAFTLRR